MAKSTRSKWKKMHRRQRAQDEQAAQEARLQRLHKKLELTVKGGISAVPPQDPEVRFHFLNPELDPRVPNTRRDLNNNYRMELNRVQYDFNKPLHLPPPKTNFFGKTDPTAPHPVTVQYETLPAHAPIAGHALTKEDMIRMAQASAAEAANTAPRDDANEEDDELPVGGAPGADEAEDDGPEEYVFGMEDTVARKVSRKKSSKKSSAGKRSAASSAAAASASPAVAAVKDMDGGATARPAGVRIATMEGHTKKNNAVVAASGTSKVKRVGTGATPATRVVSSGSNAAKTKKKSTKRQ